MERLTTALPTRPNGRRTYRRWANNGRSVRGAAPNRRSGVGIWRFVGGPTDGVRRRYWLSDMTRPTLDRPVRAWVAWDGRHTPGAVPEFTPVDGRRRATERYRAAAPGVTPTTHHLPPGRHYNLRQRAG